MKITLPSVLRIILLAPLLGWSAFGQAQPAPGAAPAGGGRGARAGGAGGGRGGVVVPSTVVPASITTGPTAGAVVTLLAPKLTPGSLAADTDSLILDGLFYQAAAGPVPFPANMSVRLATDSTATVERTSVMPDGRTLKLTVKPEGDNFTLSLTAQPNDDITLWGVALRASADEYYTGIMERVVDGAQQLSWAPGIQTGMNLRGLRINNLVQPTMAVYSPFYVSSRGYGAFVKGTWPGLFDFCVTDPTRVWVQFEGHSFEMKTYTADQPAKVVAQHALDAGPPFQAPRWTFLPWRWRDEHTQRTTYYDGTPVTGPFNSESMEDLLMMKAYGIPCGVYWIDRPWGPGRQGYNDFEIDAARLPNFTAMIKWLNEQNIQMVLWIGPFVNGKMAQEAHDKGYGIPGQSAGGGEVGPGINPARPNAGSGGPGGALESTNYPLIDFTNPAAKAFFQEGVAKLLKLGVAGFKLDRSEENIPADGSLKMANGQTLREVRNAYPAQYVQATAEISQKYRGNDFVAMPRAAYTGSAPYGVYWGGDIGGTPEGLRAEVIAVQRCAVMGYPVWGSDTGGYNQQTADQDLYSRWLEFSCFTPIMEVGPTHNLAFWDLPRPPTYDDVAIAAWRLYARLHTRLADYSFALGKVAHDTGLPIVRPLFMVDPKAPAAWSNWWTFQYGPDLLVSPIWEKGKTAQEVYLPSGNKWRYVWTNKEYDGGQTVTVDAALHQMPLFVRVGSTLPVGDLNQEWTESQAIAKQPPNLVPLDAEVKAWFDKYSAAPLPTGGR